MKKTVMCAGLVVLLMVCAVFVFATNYPEVEFTISNYTKDYALRVLNMETINGEMGENDLNETRMNDGNTKHIIYQPNSDGVVAFKFYFEVIDKPEMCGEDGYKCGFEVRYETSFLDEAGSVFIGTKPGTMKVYSSGNVFNIKNADCFTEDEKPVCKVHIEK
ncbi:MAG: hypothetical protein Q8Q33_01745 [Chlamydiota bacterium]|nr:hypothetical protein [Chlamydiota bacterium]